ncbi:MAG: carbohydrate kinase family protein [Solirubrobacterales bacterium]
MARIVVVGSVASDEVVRLAERMREGAHLNGRSAGTRLGGGGANTAVALAAAGHTVSLVTAVGDDEAGAWQLEQLAQAGVDTSAIVRVPGPSTRSIVMVDAAGERTIVNLGRAKEAEPPARLLDLAADVVYVRTRAVGLAPLMTRKAEQALIVAHVPPLAPGVFPAHVIVGSASDLDDRALSNPLATAGAVAGTLLKWVVVTRGEKGADALGTDGQHLGVAAPRVEAVDSTGAGDAFAAGLCHALARGDSMAASLAEAVRWGAAKVARDGSALTAEAVRELV